MSTTPANELKHFISTLSQWLSRQIPNAEALTIDKLANVSAGGFSADTAFFDAHWLEHGKAVSQSMVLRKQIMGHDLIHQPELQFQADIMAEMANHTLSVPVPELIGIENDSALLGVPFLVMKRLNGHIVPQNPNYNVGGWVSELPLQKRAEAWHNGVRAMAEVHKLDWRNGFEFLARGKETGLAGYISWLEDWVRWAVAGRDYPIGEATLAYLKNTMPEGAITSVVWGDGQPSNILFNEKTAQVTGLLDWELATLGPGEIDLAWWLMFDELFSEWMHVPRLEGLPNREELITTYEKAVGHSVIDMPYYDILVRLRMAIITMRAVDRQVAQGRYKADNTAWSHNPFTTDLAKRLGLAPIETGSDYIDFNIQLMKKE